MRHEKEGGFPSPVSYTHLIAVLQADVKKAQEARKAAILKKFDKDGDGKLSKEERKAMQEELSLIHISRSGRR